MNTYDQGDLVRVTGSFTSAAGAAVDPSTVTFQVKNPSGAETSYLYGVDVQLVKDSTGSYHVDVAADLPGNFYYRFKGSGAVGKSAAKNHFTVAEPDF